ncbi:MAG: hypothetical protein HW378_206 [Anaerolineales bacterium]|nr:hypothetical protein [Anaerolineales bacterium]
MNSWRPVRWWALVRLTGDGRPEAKRWRWRRGEPLCLLAPCGRVWEVSFGPPTRIRACNGNGARRDALLERLRAGLLGAHSWERMVGWIDDELVRV